MWCTWSDRAGVTGDDGPSHHGILDMALALRIPGMAVIAPSCEEDLVELLEVAVDLAGPVLLRFPKGASSRAPRSVRVRSAPARTGSARTLRDGGDVCILAVGDRVARRSLRPSGWRRRHRGIGARRPFACVRSIRRCLDAAARAPFVVTVENGMVEGGAGTEIAARLRERVGPRGMPPILHLGVPTTFIPHGDPGRILAGLGLDAGDRCGGHARTRRRRRTLFRTSPGRSETGTR
jgi:1-deoxy-D-xylulose-5-phosphate synthase